MTDRSDTPKPPRRRRRGGRASSHYRANNEGGYGNPPVRHQFKAGNEGGPGRRRGAITMDGALRKMFRTKVPVIKNGRSMRIDMAEALAERVRKVIFSDNPKALQMGMELMRKYGPTGDENMVAIFDFSALSLEQKIALRDLLQTAEMVDRHELARELRLARKIIAQAAAQEDGDPDPDER